MVHRSSVMLAFSALALSLCAQAAQRTFVSTAGSDANTAANCTNTTPCRGFAAAISVTDAGGEIIALSSGGYGAVTITKSVAITSPEGVYAGISVFSDDGITIATAGINVVLRGLTINGMGGSYGINMTNGSKLSIENCVISNFSANLQAGVFVNAPASVSIVNTLFRNNYYGTVLSSGASATISDSKFLGNFAGLRVTDYHGGSSVTTSATVERSVVSDGTYGFYARNHYAGNTSRLFVADSMVARNSYVGVEAYQSAGTVDVSVSNSRIFGNYGGLYVEGSGAKLVATGNTVTGSTYGLYTDSPGTLQSAGDNTVRDNTTDLYGAITTFFEDVSLSDRAGASRRSENAVTGRKWGRVKQDRELRFPHDSRCD